jgi:DNA-binding transcriptional ArsR family regulator
LSKGWGSNVKGDRSSVKIVDDDDIFKVLADSTRRDILAMLCQNSFSATEIAKHLKLSPQTVRYHLSKLEDVTLIQVSKKKQCQNAYHAREKVYEATAGRFHFCFGEKPSTIPVLTNCLNKLTELLQKIGVPLSSFEASLFSELFYEVDETMMNIVKKVEKVIEKRNDTPWIDRSLLANLLVKKLFQEASLDK